MKCTIPEICWHSRDPVLSVDIQVGKFKTSSGNKFWRVATGGADSHVVIWHLSFNADNVAELTYVADLERHQKAVNVVRFSPSGEILASGDDESVIVLWKQREESDIPIFPGEENENKEQWTSLKVLRGHIEDVLDISWSIDSKFLVSGSVDNSVIVWNIDKGKKIGLLSDYKGFVQGVSYDPQSKYIVSLCADRHCRLIDIQNTGKIKTIHRVSKAKIPTPEGHSVHGKSIRLFHDDTFQSYFRRLTFTPDGSLIIAPSGLIESIESNEKSCNCAIIFSRHNLKEPVAVLPTFDEPTIAVSCCPVYYKLRKDGPKSVVDLPYRIIFTVATQHSVLLFDTQQLAPFAVVSNIHYTRLTDATWSSDGKVLMVSSTDGYCSIIHFEEEELGEVYELIPKINEPSKEDIKKLKSKSATLPVPFFDNEEAVDIDLSNKKNEKMELDESVQENKDADQTEDFELVLDDTVSETVNSKNSKLTPTKTEMLSKPIAKTPRRVQLITLSSPKRTKME